MRRFPLLLLCAAIFCAAWSHPASAQILKKKKPVDKSTDSTNAAEPDKQLYDRAMEDIRKSKYEIGRLTLQTLINTYPDSEYLAKAKLAIADSFYKEGGTSNITQAIAAYKDYIVFFPFTPEAAYAQAQVAMCHFNEMPKPDRDNAHAKEAELEFQTFLTKYPKDPLAPVAQQRLREVQEVIAEGQYRIGYFYYVKGDKRAAAGRLIPMVKRYPLYSKSDDALWMLGDIYEKSERKDIAGMYYAQIVKYYPLSDHAPQAKDKLIALKVPVPQPDPQAVKWMTAEQNAPRPKESVVHKSFGMLHPGPDVHQAAQNGVPQMEAESDTPSGGDVLNGANAHMTAGTGGPSTSLVTKVAPGDPTPTPGSPEAKAEDVNSTESTTPDPAATTQPAAGTEAAPATETSSESTTDAAASNGQSTATTPPTNNNGKESSSKKKGIKKLIPW